VDIGAALQNSGAALLLSAVAAILVVIASGSIAPFRTATRGGWRWRPKKADQQLKDFVDKRVGEIKAIPGVLLPPLDEQRVRISLEQEWFIKKQVEKGVMGLVTTGGTFVSLAAGAVGVYQFIETLVRGSPK
jgi:hypothetical protein